MSKNKKWYRYPIVSKFALPDCVDMLRYDLGYVAFPWVDRDIRTDVIWSPRSPNLARWRSFGIIILQKEAVRIDCPTDELWTVVRDNLDILIWKKESL